MTGSDSHGSSTTSFTYTGLPARVVFGRGTLDKLGDELDRLAIKRALILTTPEQTAHGRSVLARIGERAAGSFHGAAMHTPVEVTAAALDVARELAADGLIAIGGGSTIGLGKAIAVRTGLPQLAIPTTYAGSEMTPILGETEHGKKATRRSLEILPEVVIYDVELTLGLPVAISATSGMNAIAHAVEALYAQDGNPIIAMFAEQGIAALARSLPIIVHHPGDLAAREAALYGAWLCAVCLGAAGMALHHKLCHVLGGSFDLPHAETHTVVLPHAVAYNADAAPEAMQRIARALGSADAATGLYELAGTLGAPRSLRAIGMPADGLDRAVELALANPYWNPRPLERAALRGLLERAFTGAPPR